MAQEKKAAPDWERIEADYRAGLLSVREIASAHGISHTYINTRAKKLGWLRDLSKRIQDKAEALVSNATVSTVVSMETAISDKALARIRMAHRGDISRSRQLVMLLLGELEQETGDIDLFRELGEIMRADDDRGTDRRNDLYNKVISSAGRIDSMKKLADTMKTLVALEREAYGLPDASAPVTNITVNPVGPTATVEEIQVELKKNEATRKV
jgi:hypothetical protein